MKRSFFRDFTVLLPIMILGFTSFFAEAGQGVQDTAVERLFQTHQFKATSDLIANRLAHEGPKLSQDLRLYYYNTLSMAQLRLNIFDSALNCARKSIGIASTSTDSTLVSNAWKVMSYAYNRSGQLDSALYFTNKLLNYAKRVGDDRQSRNALTSIATILMQNKRFGEALKYYREVQSINIKINDTAAIALNLFNIGLVWLSLNQYDSCLYYLQKTVLLSEGLKQSDLLVYTYGTMADCYLAMGNKTARKKYLLMANGIALKLGNLQFVAMGYSNLLEGSLNDKDFANALKYGLTADSLLKKAPYPALQMKVDSMIYVAMSRLGRPTEALAWHELFLKIKNQVISETQLALMNKMLVEYQVKEKDLTIEKQNLEIRSKKRQLQLLALLLFITALFIAGMIRYVMKTRRFRETLYQKEEYLDRQIADMVKYKFSGLRENPAMVAKPAIEPKNGIADNQGPDDLIPHDALYARFVDMIEIQKLYLDPELNLKSIINLLGTNKKYMYEAISKHSGGNFRSLVNRYRVAEAKKIIQESIRTTQSVDTEAIYSSAGFNSAVSFYRAFKNFTGLTPKEYANETRKEFRKRDAGLAQVPDAVEEEDL